MEKKCNKCKKVLDISLFGVESRSKNGYKPRCKKCVNEYNKKYISENKENYKKYSKKYYEKNKESIINKAVHYARNSEKIQEYRKKFVKENKTKLNKKRREWYKIKVENEPSFAFAIKFRALVYRSNWVSQNSTEKTLGYSYSDLIKSLGGLPKKGYDIDHKVPVFWFKKDAPPNIVNSLSNLQLLPSLENQKKGSSYNHKISLEFLNEIKIYLKQKYINQIKTK